MTLLRYKEYKVTMIVTQEIFHMLVDNPVSG